MGIFDNCLLVTDIDGTLIFGDNLISERNIKAIEYFKSEGGLFTIATGRAAAGINGLYEMSGANTYAIVGNGSGIYDFYEKDYKVCNYLPHSTKKTFVDLVKLFPEISVEVQHKDQIYKFYDSKDIDDHLHILRMEAKLVDISEVLGIEWTKASFISSNKELLDKFYAYVSNQNYDGFYFLRTGVPYVEMLSSKAKKEAGISALVDILGNIKQTFAIGDYYNDIGMLDACDVSCAVAEAPLEVKKSADYIACSCKDGAVADFIGFLNKDMSCKQEYL
ncbi:MAG: HAD-IIB family hydrolase [bacterium]|nr:HAD-IIB family hydrolase [bacterium]